MTFSNWLEGVNYRINNDLIDTLKKAKDRIGQYTSMDFRAATDADQMLRGARGFMRIAHGATADQDMVFNLTRLANTCNHLSHLDPNKKAKIAQIQADIDGIIAKLQATPAA